MDVTPEELLQLLELQKIDSAIDRLNARVRNLPEQQQLDELSARLKVLDRAIGEKQAEVDEVATRLRRMENDIDSMEKKIAMEQKRLNSGDVNNPREIANLSAEVDSLNKRKSKLEDDDLVIMEESEVVERQLKDISEEIEQVRSEIEATIVQRDEANAEVAEQLEEARPRRVHWAGRTPPELLKFYDDLRVAKGGVGAARLEGSTCLGCHMQLPAQEIERLRKSSGVTRCEECGRILVVPGKS